jgi:transcriptional regulator with XRE-family HTH domain
MNEITPAQIRAARSLLGWNQRDLAEKSGVHFKTIARLELDSGEQHAVSRLKVRRGLEAEGVVFVAEDERLGPGVRLTKGLVPTKQTPSTRKNAEKASDEQKRKPPGDNTQS